MNVNKVGIFSAYKASFKSLRADKEQVVRLAKGDKPIIENNKRNIYTALSNLSNVPTYENIEFLLDVADNLAYGQGRNSEFKDKIDNDCITPENRENTDWLALLEDTVNSALSKSDDDNIGDLILDFKRIFNDKKQLTPEQTKVLELRSKLNKQILKDTENNDSEGLLRKTRTRQNLDYFTASSEIPIKQKQEVLEKLTYFMSGRYKINPQLQNYKLQVLDEMLGDLVVKAPDDEILKTKDIDQCMSGMCASISICRKQMAYEDKVKFVDLIMDELKDSPVMSVYDVTELGSGKKVDIPKTSVNYNIAMAKGYRIIDASAHHWMHNAHAGGNGTIQLEHYISFDDENYGIFDDSSIYEDKQEEHHEEKQLLRALIKEREFIKSFMKMKKDMSNLSSNLNKIRKDSIYTQTKSNGKLREVLSSVYKDKSDLEITHIISSLYKFYTHKKEDNEANIGSKLSEEVKQNIISEYLINSVSGTSEEQKKTIKDNSPLITNMVEAYIDADKKLLSLNKFQSKRSQYVYNKRLFNIAAAHRTAFERDVALHDGVTRYEKPSGLEPRDIEISKYIRSLQYSFSSQKLREQYKDQNGIIPSEEQLKNDLMADLVQLETIIPGKINEISSVLFGKDFKGLVAATFNKLSERIIDGDNDSLKLVKSTLNIKGSKNEIANYLIQKSKNIASSASEKDLLEAVRALGYESRMHLFYTFISQYYQSLNSAGLNEDIYNQLKKAFGGEDKIAEGLENQRQNYMDIQNKYLEILNKWNVPEVREQIISKYEQKKDILSRRQLDALNHHILSIQAGVAANDKIQNTKEREKANDALYTFSDSEKEVFKSIEKHISEMRKYANMEYDNLNDILYKELEDQYSTMGMLNGNFWVGEEGSTGLMSNEQLRIIEQMTGQPYHIEKDINDAAEEIKKGNGSGIISSSVADDDYAFHAQYIPSVTSETFTNPATGEKLVRDVLWTDNSWGNSEKNYFWNGKNGFEYTDYGSGYGWKDGFILDKDRKIGLPVKDIHGAIGVNKDDGDKFGLFNDVILPGSPVGVYQNLYKVFSYILNIDEGKKYLDSLESALNNGYKFNPDIIEDIDKIIDNKEAEISERLDKEIKSEEDFDKLPDKDPLKFTFMKLAAYLSTDNPELQEDIADVETNEELKAVQENVFDEHLNVISTLICKSQDTIQLIQSYSSDAFDKIFDDLKNNFGIELSEENRVMLLHKIFFDEESIKTLDGSLKKLEMTLVNNLVTSSFEYIDDEDAVKYFIEEGKKAILDTIDNDIRIKSLECPVLTNSPLREELYNAVDKYLSPESNQELLTLIQQLQNADYKTADRFLDSLQPEDVGIKIKKPYDYVLMYKTGNADVYKAFSEVVTVGEINKNLNQSEDNEASTPEELYRTLYVKLSEMDVQKFIKAYKAEAFKKYKVRQAFPDPVVLPEEEIRKTVYNAAQLIDKQVASINQNQNVVNLLNAYSKLQKDYIYNSDFIGFLNQDEIQVNEKNTLYLLDFINTIGYMFNLASRDESFAELSVLFNNILQTILHSDNIVKTAGIKEDLNNIVIQINKFIDNGMTLSRFKRLKKEEVSELKSNMQLFTNTNIDPKYRDDANRYLNRIADLCRKDSADEEEIKDVVNNLADFTVERHIVKNPTVLLKEVVKLLLAGKANSNEYKIMKEYLIDALEVAQQTKIQYKLVQNQRDGISSKLKKMLPLFTVTHDDGTVETMDSEAGMIYLVEKLKNTSDNYKTLNLFLEQSGLSQRALIALINTFNFDKIDEVLREKTDIVKQNIKGLDCFASAINKYLASNKVQYPTLKAAIAAIIDYAKLTFPDYKETESYNMIIERLESYSCSDKQEFSPEVIKDTLVPQLLTDALTYFAGYVSNQMKTVGEIEKLFGERVNLILSIRVPDGSNEFKEREKFLKRYQKIDKLLEQRYNDVIKASDKCSFLHIENT